MAPYLPVGEALARRYPTDAHAAAYSIPAVAVVQAESTFAGVLSKDFIVQLNSAGRGLLVPLVDEAADLAFEVGEIVESASATRRQALVLAPLDFLRVLRNPYSQPVSA